MEIRLSEAQTRRMLKAKSFLEDAYDDGKLRGMTTTCIREMSSCYNEIIDSVEHYGVTIFKDVANTFRKLGFRVEDVETFDTIPHWRVHILTKKQEKELDNCE